MSQAAKVRLEDLDIKPYDLAISIPHQLVDVVGGMLEPGTDEHVAPELVTKASCQNSGNP